MQVGLLVRQLEDGICSQELLARAAVEYVNSAHLLQLQSTFQVGSL